MTTGVSRPAPPNGFASAGAHRSASATLEPPVPGAARLLTRGRRRRPAMIALGLALVATGGAAAAAITMAAGDRAPVLVVVRSVDAGTAVVSADLGVARVAPDPQLEPIPARRRGEVVGQVAGVDLRPGTLLSRAQLEAVAIPGPDQALVGVALAPGRLPARPLQRGDRVLTVVASDQASAVQSGVDPPTARLAEVVSTGPAAPDGTVVVDLSVAQQDAAELAAHAAAGQISIILLPRAR